MNNGRVSRVCEGGRGVGGRAAAAAAASPLH